MCITNHIKALVITVWFQEEERNPCKEQWDTSDELSSVADESKEIRQVCERDHPGEKRACSNYAALNGNLRCSLNIEEVRKIERGFQILVRGKYTHNLRRTGSYSFAATARLDFIAWSRILSFSWQISVSAFHP